MTISVVVVGNVVVEILVDVEVVVFMDYLLTICSEIYILDFISLLCHVWFKFLQDIVTIMKNYKHIFNIQNLETLLLLNTGFLPVL